VVIDFDLINKQIDELVSKGKVLMYCKDGESISPAFAISYLMYKAKLDISTATLKVCQAISRV
jgi:protein-tyrosine phosphatase